MYQLTIKGKPVGVQYTTKKAAIKAFIRLQPCILGLGWARCKAR